MTLKKARMINSLSEKRAQYISTDKETELSIIDMFKYNNIILYRQVEKNELLERGMDKDDICYYFANEDKSKEYILDINASAHIFSIVEKIIEH